MMKPATFEPYQTSSIGEQSGASAGRRSQLIEDRASALFLFEQPELAARLAAGTSIMPKKAGTRRFCPG